jgi:hypothetical protein
MHGTTNFKLETYHGAPVMDRRILDCSRCMICVWDGFTLYTELTLLYISMLVYSIYEVVVERCLPKGGLRFDCGIGK